MGWSVYYSEKYDELILIAPDDSSDNIIYNIICGNTENIGYIKKERLIKSDYQLIGYL
jgi:hypothetical protein